MLVIIKLTDSLKQSADFLIILHKQNTFKLRYKAEKYWCALGEL